MIWSAVLLCRECHSLLTVSLFVSPLYTCVRSQRRLVLLLLPSLTMRISFLTIWGSCPTEGRLKRLHIKCGILGGDIIIIIIIIIITIILASPFNQCMCDTWKTYLLPVVTHTGIPTLDHGKNAEQNLGWLLIL